jgi:hypothetical protein
VTVILTGVAALILLMWLPKAKTLLVNQLRFKSIEPSIHRKWHLPVAVVIAGVGMAPFAIGLDRDAIFEWWEVFGFWGWIVALAPVVFTVVLNILVLLQVMHLIKWLLGNLPDLLDVKPLAPDGSGGLEELGRVITGLALYALSMGLWMAIQNGIALPLWNNKGREWTEISGGLVLNGILLLMVYSVLVYFLLIMPAWRIRRVMLKSRDIQLNRVSDEFVRVLGDTEPDPRRRLSLMVGLRREHDMIKDTFPAFPFTVPRLRLLTVITSSPPIIGTISLTFQFFGSEIKIGS